MRSTIDLLLLFGAAALGAAFLLGGHYLPWTTFEQEVAAAIGASLWAVAALAQGGTSLPVSRLAALFALLSTVPLLQYCGGSIAFHSDALLPASYLLAFALSILTGHSLGLERVAAGDEHRPRPLQLLLAALLVAAALSAAGGLWQWQRLPAPLSMGPNLSGARISANLGQPNHLATLLLWGSVASLYFAAVHRWSTWTSGCLLILLGLGLVMTQSRAGVLGAMAVSAWAAWKGPSSGVRVSRRGVAIVCLLLLALILSWPSINDLLYLADAGGLSERLQPGRRWIHWATLLDASLRQPWLGYGWSQVSMAQWAAALDHPAGHEPLTQSHNLVLDLAIYNGWPIAIAVCGLGGGYLVRQVRACRSPSQWALLASLFVLLTHAMVEFPHDYAFFLFPAGLMVGLLQAESPAPAEGWSVPRVAGAVALAALGGLLIAVSVEYLKVQSSFRDLRFREAGFVKDGGDAPPPPPDVRLLDQPRQFHRFMLTPARPGMAKSELEWMQQVTQRFPIPPAMMRYALASGLNAEDAEAMRTLRLLCSIQPVKRCEEGRETWQKAQDTYPQLRRIPFPEAADATQSD